MSALDEHNARSRNGKHEQGSGRWRCLQSAFRMGTLQKETLVTIYPTPFRARVHLSQNMVSFFSCSVDPMQGRWTALKKTGRFLNIFFHSSTSVFKTAKQLENSASIESSIFGVLKMSSTSDGFQSVSLFRTSDLNLNKTQWKKIAISLSAMAAGSAGLSAVSPTDASKQWNWEIPEAYTLPPANTRDTSGLRRRIKCETNRNTSSAIAVIVSACARCPKHVRAWQSCTRPRHGR